MSFDMKEDCNAEEEAQAGRDRYEAAAGRCSGLGDPSTRGGRGDVLSLASGVRTSPDRTSKSAVPTIDPTRRRHGCSRLLRSPPSRSPHEYEQCILPTDAKGKGPCAPRSYGRSVVALYNGADRIRALTARHPIMPTSPRCPSAWQPNPGKRSTYRRGKSVQKTGTSSIHRFGTTS